MKCSFVISNFLEEISSLSHSIVFLHFFALITEVGFLISPCYSLELFIQMGIFEFSALPFTSVLYSAICKASSDNHFAFLHFLEQQTGSKSGKEYIKAACCHPASLTYAEQIMQNAALEEAQAGIKIARRNINNLRYADDTTLMAESEELKSLLMKVKEESEKFGLKLIIWKTKIMASCSITSWQIDGETMQTVRDYFFGGGSKITADGDCSHGIKRCLLLGRKAMTNGDSMLKSRHYFANKGPF